MKYGKNRRRRYLVNKRLQMQFALLLVTQLVIPTVMFGGVIYIINKMYLSCLQYLIGKSVVSDAYVQSILNFSILALGLFLAISVLLVIFLGVRFSHHVAGPLYKLEQVVDRLANGQEVEPLHFRKTDVIDGLDSKFNAIAKKLNLLKK